jgi:hypothetical protein
MSDPVEEILLYLAQFAPNEAHRQLDHYRSILARLKKTEAVLREIANDGCGMSVACREQHPDDRSDWCWCCMAKDALEDKP